MSRIIGYYYPQTAEFRRTRKDKGRKRLSAANKIGIAAATIGIGGGAAALLSRRKGAVGRGLIGKGRTPGGAITLHAQELRPRFRTRSKSGSLATVGTTGAVKLYEDQVLRPYNRSGAPYRTGRMAGSSSAGLLRGSRPSLAEGSLTTPGRSPSPYRSSRGIAGQLPSRRGTIGPNSSYRKPGSGTPSRSSPPVSRKKRGYSK
ncbi:MAG TPA: hypothetical protein V6C65_04290 [Allocoleopsis sp.]